VATAQADDSHCQPGIGQKRADTPSTEFELPRNGTIIHSRTGLQWAQCALGQSWSRDFCAGQATPFRWDDARQAIERLNTSGVLGGFSDWRLPTRRELETIIERCRENPTINTSIFPDTPSAGFWTGSRNTVSGANAWFVGFYSGRSLQYSRNASYLVRPVRTR